jgi:hypothetical protein
MKLAHGLKRIVLVSVVVTVVCANVSTADMSALPSGDIAACDFLGRGAVPSLADSLLSEHQVIATWLEAFSGWGINSRYSQDWVVLAIEGLELTSSVMAAPAMHMYRESGLELPDATQINLTGGSDYHSFSGWVLFDRMSAVAGICDLANKHGLADVDPAEWLVSPLSHHENPLGYLHGTVFGKAIGSRSY